MEILRRLISCSEKAAVICKVCRCEKDNFKVFVQEKSEEEKNTKFKHDFKTFADVLVQETIRRDLMVDFPDFADHILGEETPSFKFADGSEKQIIIPDDLEETVQLLKMSKMKSQKMIENLAIVINTVPAGFVLNHTVETPDLDISVRPEELAVWIDPIDATAEYVNGEDSELADGICVKGLGCVCILIGAYYRETGIPAMGVINSPYCNMSDHQQLIWGVNCEGISAGNLGVADRGHDLALIGHSEGHEVEAALRAGGWNVLRVAGAGNKFAALARGLAAIAVTSGATLYAWDTCAPHALLAARGGGIISYDALAYSREAIQLSYSGVVKHLGGAIAYRDPEALQKLRFCEFPPKPGTSTEASQN